METSKCFILIGIFFNLLQGAANTSVGSVLFYRKSVNSQCWTPEEVTKLRTRQIFDELVPLHAEPDKINNKYVKNVLKYFKRAVSKVDSVEDSEISEVLKDVLIDTFGAHLRSEILPNVRFAYYAGYVSYRNARNIHDYYDDIKSYLNTAGVGWKEPQRMNQWSNLTVEKIPIGVLSLFDPCYSLVSRRDSRSCIYLPSPKIDDFTRPSAMVLPFKSDGLVSLVSANSENALIKYYTTASRCILQRAPRECRHADFVNFNNEMWHWMKREVSSHLTDETLYAAFGGVFRVAASVQSYGRGLTRRNPFTRTAEKRRPWLHLSNSSLVIDSDWCTAWYIAIVIAIAGAIAIIHFLYNYLIGDGCNCKGKKSVADILKHDVSYAHVETTFPAVLPQHPQLPERLNPQPSMQKRLFVSNTVGSVHTERVYDLNENSEKVMKIIMSDSDDSSNETTTSSSGRDEDDNVEIKKVTPMPRARSPPKLETPISQVRVSKTRYSTGNSCQLPVYTTSESTTTSQATCRRRLEPSCPDSQTSTSPHSASSGTGTSEAVASETATESLCCSRSHSSRKLPCGWRAVSKHDTSTDGATKTITGTKLNRDSYTTLPSKR